MSITPTYSLKASQTPPPVVLSVGMDRNAVTDTSLPSGSTYTSFPWNVAGTFTLQDANKLLADIANSYLFGGNQPGIFSGLEFSTPAGLDLSVSAGLVSALGPMSVAGYTWFSIPASSTVYVWLLKAGSLFYSTSLSTPSNGLLYLGAVTTSGSAITGFDYSGVVRIVGNSRVRKTYDIGYPDDTLSSNEVVHTKTQSGTYIWDGDSHKSVDVGIYTASIGADLVLDANAPNILWITPTGANRKVKLPSTPRKGQSITVVNAALSGGHNILVTDSTGSTTYVTVAPGETSGPTVAGSSSSSGVAKFPTSAWATPAVAA